MNSLLFFNTDVRRFTGEASTLLPLSLFLLSRDLAQLYNVSTGVLNQAVKRNKNRFPDDFMFQITKEEFDILISQFVTSSWGGRRKLPNAFTEQGVAMLYRLSGREVYPGSISESDV